MRFRTVLQLALAFFLLGILIPATDRGRALPTGNANLPIVAGAEKVWTHTLDVDADGALHILWTDDRTGERDVYYARSVDGSAWSPPVRVDTGGMAVNADHPSLAVERESVASRGRLYVT
ncbi:MAG TPA: hypothetical protein VEM95_02640, partial [Thermoplasmata archaeon]|nr:hypothetical protein [Thermoplasmata archaeon]